MQGGACRSGSGRPLDTHTVIWLLPRGIEEGVRLNHVVHHVALGDLFGAELLRRRQVHAVVVPQVVVAHDGGRLYSEKTAGRTARVLFC